ncbi:hypothetical protein [Luteimonas sp. R10]|uniref:hypothetical protein n=1 Tax=Luteimonas sp. R10 TaxID=3108176 RepID=UPI0030898BB5|nr:hypothetical protein U3649_09730 [Luteimonas sp. R10]
MNKWRLSASVFLVTVACSAAALAAVHHFDVIGEAYGHTSEEAIDNALRVAETKCYRSWGRSSQEYAVLAEWVDPATGYPYARVSVGCAVED